MTTCGKWHAVSATRQSNKSTPHYPLPTSMTARTPTLIGLPYDASSSFLQGAAAAPPMIRQTLASPAGNLWTEALDDLSVGLVLADAGDLELPPSAEARALIEEGIGHILGD